MVAYYLEQLRYDSRMSPVVAVCPTHGPFQSRAIAFGSQGGAISFGGNVTNLVFSGGIEDCPRCGAASRLMDGRFNVRDGVVEILSAPRWTRDAIEQARQALQDLDLGVLRSQKQVINELEKTSPLAAQLVSKAWTRSDKIAVLSLVVSSLISLLGILMGHMDSSEEPPLSPEQIEVIVKQVMDHADKQNDPPKSP